MFACRAHLACLPKYDLVTHIPQPRLMKKKDAISAVYDMIIYKLPNYYVLELNYEASDEQLAFCSCFPGLKIVA